MLKFQLWKFIWSEINWFYFYWDAEFKEEKFLVKTSWSDMVDVSKMEQKLKKMKCVLRRINVSIIIITHATLCHLWNNQRKRQKVNKRDSCSAPNLSTSGKNQCMQRTRTNWNVSQMQLHKYIHISIIIIWNGLMLIC